MPIINLSEYDKREAAFSVAFGKVLMEWAYVENSLFLLFEHLTGLPEALARALFYSARSYNGRVDMISAIMDVSNKAIENPIIKEIAKEAISKANKYVAFRNSLAHNIAIASATENGAVIVLIEGKHGTEYGIKSGILIDHLEIAANNFNKLSHIIKMLIHASKLQYSERIPEFLEQLRMLPNAPSQKEPSIKQVKCQRQRKFVPRKVPPSSQNQ